MKSKRVTKLLACVLSVAMCATPVWATSYGDETGSGTITGGKIDTEVGVYAPPISVNVPIKTKIEVNPMISQNSPSVNGYGIASKSLVITNKSYDTDNSEGIPIIVTAEAEIQKKEDSVKVYYDKTRSGYTASANSKAKEAYMSLSEGNMTVPGTSGNVVYKTAGKKSDVITTAGSQIQFSVSAPNAASAKTYAAFAVVGDANVNAPWENNDMTIGLTYAIKAGSTGIKGKIANVAAISSIVNGANVTISATSTNGISINNFPENGVDGAEVEAIVVHPTKASEADWVVDATDLQKVNYKQNSDGTWNITIPGGEDLAYYSENFTQKNRDLDLLIRLNDGRVLMDNLSIN